MIISIHRGGYVRDTLWLFPWPLRLMSIQGLNEKRVSCLEMFSVDLVLNTTPVSFLVAEEGLSRCIVTMNLFSVFISSRHTDLVSLPHQRPSKPRLLAPRPTDEITRVMTSHAPDPPLPKYSHRPAFPRSTHRVELQYPLTRQPRATTNS